MAGNDSGMAVSISEGPGIGESGPPADHRAVPANSAGFYGSEAAEPDADRRENETEPNERQTNTPVAANVSLL